MMLRATDLACARGGLRILESVSFTLLPGRALILRGPNGSGKTTLLRTIAGLQPAVDGQIEVAPESIAYAGHADGIKPTLTVAENLRFWGRIFGASDIDTALHQFDLAGLRDRPAQNLSAGQKRRLGLARLAVTGRPVWLLDEPTVSLDTASVTLFADAVQAHLKGAGSALIATHIDLGIEAETLDVGQFRAAVAGPDDDPFTGALV